MNIDSSEQALLEQQQTIETDPVLANRYGKSGSSRKAKLLKVWLSFALLLVAIVTAAWYALAPNKIPTIETQIISFEVLNDHQLQLTFQVTFDREKTSFCGIEAVNKHKAAVGYREIEIPPSSERTRILREVIESTEPSVTGLISGCVTQ